MKRVLLIVEDDEAFAKSLQKFLDWSGYDVRLTSTPGDAAIELAAFQPDVVLLDHLPPDAAGLSVLRSLRPSAEGASFILMIAQVSVPVAVAAMKAGAFDIIAKPIMLEELERLLEKACNADHRHDGRHHFRRKPTAKAGLDALRGDSAAMSTLRAQIANLLEAEARLDGDVPPAVLISGETGVGKQLVARALHFDSPRRSGPFVEIDCAVLSDQEVEAELFGHDGGCSADASQRRSGLVETADRGTLFFDEIGEMPAAVQGKLLKFLENQMVRRVGRAGDRKVNVRVLAASNRPLKDLIRVGKFRADLLYRLNTIEVEVPPLRDRSADVELLASLFLELEARRYKRGKLSFTRDAGAAMRGHGWPGNVRELRNVVERAVLESKSDTIDATMLALPPRATTDLRPTGAANGASALIKLPSGGLDLTTVEKQLLEQALERSRWNVASASRLLGVSRDTLRYRMGKFDLLRPAAAH